MHRSPEKISAQKRFELFMEAASDYALFFMERNGSINEWSRGAEKIIGYSAEEAVQLSGRMIFTPEDRADGVPEQEMETALREGQANDERWHLRKDGSRFFAVGRLVALQDEEKQVHGFAKILRDATPRKNLEKALHASDERFRATFAQSPAGMALTDLTGRVQHANAALCRMVGRSEEELRGQDLRALAVPEHAPMLAEAFAEMLARTRPSAVMDKRLQRPDGSTLWVQESVALLRDLEGAPMAFIDLCQDISLLKMSEEELGQLVDQRTADLREKTKQLEAFCYTVAHDLRAPLRAIAGYAEIVRLDFAPDLPARVLEYVNRMKVSAARLDELISDLLGYTRIEQVQLAKDDVDLTAVAQRAVDHVRRDSDVPFTVELVAPLGRARADATTIEHVFSNLVSNAVKFRRAEEPAAIRICAEQQPGRVRVWVEDNGIGIDPRFQQRVFQIFERLPTSKNVPGTGVGLAIVATAMSRLGGGYGVEPNTPHGSRFWIEFPTP